MKQHFKSVHASIARVVAGNRDVYGVERGVRPERASVPHHVHAQPLGRPGPLVHVRELAGKLDAHFLDHGRNLGDPFPVGPILLRPPVRAINGRGAFQGFDQILPQTGFAQRGSFPFQIGASLHRRQLIVDDLHVAIQQKVAAGQVLRVKRDGILPGVDIRLREIDQRNGKFVRLRRSPHGFRGRGIAFQQARLKIQKVMQVHPKSAVHFKDRKGRLRAGGLRN